MEDVQERKFGGLTVRILRDMCIGSSNCVKIAPEVFELDDDGIVTFKEDAPEIERERLVEACQVCPVDALEAVDESGNVVSRTS